LGAVLMSDTVYQGIANGDAAAIVGHGHTYSAHPVSAAIGLEVLRLYHEGGLLANGVRHAERFARGLDALLAHPLVGDSRHRGLLGALELVSDKETKKGFDASLNLSERITAAAYRNRLVFRAFGDNILGFAPALSYTEAEFDLMFERLEKTLDDVLAEPEVRAALKLKTAPGGAASGAQAKVKTHVAA
jgi:adenosylmethionine-8-amino-7-oxononanoate aminotransferase